MKIVQVVRSDSFAGVERYITLVAPRLARRGFEVVAVGGSETKMVRSLGGVVWLPGSTTRDVVRQLLRLGRVDIVHAHMTAAEAATVATKWRHRGRIVSTAHFASRRGHNSRWLSPNWLERWIDAEVAISQFVAKERGIDRVIHNGVNASDEPVVSRERVLLVMQRLESEKKTMVALRAWASSGLCERGWRMAIAGTGSLAAELHKRAYDLGVSDSVDWLGFVDEPQELLGRVGALLATAPAEPFGLTVAEAMARATPVIASDGGAHRETLGDDSWLYPPDDVDACAKLIDRLDVLDREAYGLRLRARQQELFNIESHVGQLVSLYQELLV